MKTGDIVYYIETNNQIKEAQIIAISGDFCTIKYGKVDPHYISGGKKHLEATGGIRLRKSKLFPTKEKAEAFIKNRNIATKSKKCDRAGERTESV